MAIVLIQLIPAMAIGQFYNGLQMSFGKNRVQCEDFIWSYYRFDDFDVYFYQGGKELAQFAAEYSAEVVGEIEDKLDAILSDKIQFVVFNSLNDLKQSNIGLVAEQQYNTGGMTHIIGSRVILYFDGSRENLKLQIRAGIAETIINEMLYGNSIASQVKNTTLFPFPEWYINGLVSFIAEDWSTEIDNQVRDGILSGRYKKLNHLLDEEARYAGHSFWKYIAEEHGDASIYSILNLAKASKKLDNGFTYVIGIPLNELMDRWYTYFKERYESFEAQSEPITEAPALKIKPRAIYSQVKISPDGNDLVYVQNISGRYKVIVQNRTNGKKKVILRGGYKMDEKVDFSYPLVEWHPTGQLLAIILEKKSRPYLYYYDLNEKKFEKVLLHQMEKVLDFSYSHDGYYMAMSAVQRGQSDIYVYDVGSNSYQQITKDPYDDRFPHFYKNDSRILFSSNRISDTLKYFRKYEAVEEQKHLDIFMYDLDRESDILKRISNTSLADEIMPSPYLNGSICYLSDRNGVFNRYLAALDSTIAFVDTTVNYRYFTREVPLTNYSRNILEHHVNPSVNMLTQVVYRNQQYAVYQVPLQYKDLHSDEGLDETFFMDERIDRKKQENDTSLQDQKLHGKYRGFYTVRQSDVVEMMMADDFSGSDSLEQIQLIQQKLFETTNRKKGFTNFKYALPGQQQKEQMEMRNYYVEYYLSDLVTQIDFSYLFQTYQFFSGGGSPIYLNPGLNGLFKIGVTDLMEDYRITGGIMVNMNFKNNEYLFSYANLKKRWDKEIIFHRQPNFYTNNYSAYKLNTHELFYILKYPFNRIFAIKGTASYRNDMQVTLSTDALSLMEQNRYLHMTGGKLELVYDNTKNLGTNLFDGTRFKIFGEYNYIFNSELNQYMVVLGADFRHYIKIHRSFIWANRFAISTSIGKSKLIYYMGGVDNWLLPKYDDNTPIDYSQNYLYQTLATNMRGFYQNIRNGNSFFVINSELRFPVFKYFSRFPLRSEFLNDFQLLGFGDVGTAWTGLHPYAEENFLYTEIIEQNPLYIRVRAYREPIVGGFGVGARTKLLGYFLRADLAWGVEEMEVRSPVFHISLSLDF